MFSGTSVNPAETIGYAVFLLLGIVCATAGMYMLCRALVMSDDANWPSVATFTSGGVLAFIGGVVTVYWSIVA